MLDSPEIELWDDAFAIGNHRIDMEHRMFVGLIRDFMAACDDGAPRERLLMILEEVALFARFHFKSEENVMHFHGYRELDGHRALHQGLMERIGVKMMQFQFDQVTAPEIGRFLLEWFRDHVLHEDSKMAGFLQALR